MPIQRVTYPRRLQEVNKFDLPSSEFGEFRTSQVNSDGSRSKFIFETSKAFLFLNGDRKMNWDSEWWTRFNTGRMVRMDFRADPYSYALSVTPRLIPVGAGDTYFAAR